MASSDLLDPRLRSPRVTATAPSQTGGCIGNDGESEWEYEYSATETETFYVTLDLSKADFRAQEQVKNPSQPFETGMQTHKTSGLLLGGNKVADRASHNSGASSAASSDAERDGEDLPKTSQKDQSKQRSSAGDGSPINNERVQILELHSENPIVSYKGRVFSGQWCENTTTELLLVRHDEDSSLPVLRYLDNGVDLLAASASRINVKEQSLKPKTRESERQRASAHLPQTIIPPVDPKASQERTDQRNFLADLIAIKRRKGETDDVTVIARSMQGKRTKTKPKSTRTHRRGRWAHADKPHLARGSEERPRRGGRRKGSGRARGKWALFPLERPPEGSASITSSIAGAPVDDESGISTPTPFRWDDLEEGQGGSSPTRMEEHIEADIDDEQDEDEADFDDNEDYEEDEEDDQEEMDEDDEDV